MKGAAPAEVRASIPADLGTKSNADVWDAWPVSPAVFGEATTTARRAADDALGVSEVGRDWSRRVDDALHGLDAVDPARLDAWMATHADSPAPELYEARLVAAWESRAAADAAEAADNGDVEADLVDLDGDAAAPTHGQAPGVAAAARRTEPCVIRVDDDGNDLDQTEQADRTDGAGWVDEDEDGDGWP